METRNTKPDVGIRGRRWKRIATAAAAGLATLIFSQSAAAATTEPTTEPAGPLVVVDGSSSDALKILELTVGKSQILNTRVPVKRLNVASPEIADVNPIGPQSVLVTAKKAGTT